MRIKTAKTNSNTNYYIIKDFKINGKLHEVFKFNTAFEIITNKK